MEQSPKKHRILGVPFADIYPLYITKVERKNRTRAEVDKILYWLTGHTESSLAAVIKDRTTLENFFNIAPKLNQNRKLITGVICGVRVEDIEDPIMQEIRYMDKLIDELAKGKPMAKILRTS